MDITPAESPSAVDQPSRAALGLGFDLAEVAMVVADGSLRIISANPAAGRMLGADQVIGRSLLDFSPPAHRALVQREAIAWLGGDLEPLTRETELLLGSGERVRVVVQLNNLCLNGLEAGPGHRSFLVQLRDVTTERQKDHALAASDLRYRRLVDTLPDSSVVLFDEDLRVTSAAGESLVAGGFDPDAMAGQMIVDLTPPPGWELLESRYRETLAGRSTDFDYDSPTAGRQYRVRTRPVTNRKGEVIGGLMMSEDVSADRARQSQLEQIHRLGQLGSCWYDLRSGWCYDADLLALWGATPAGDAAGFPLDLLAPEDRVAIEAAWQKSVTSGGRHTVAYRIRHGRTGEVRHLQGTQETVLDSEGVVIRVVATHVDITETVVARELAERARAESDQERLTLLRRVGDSLATSGLDPDDMMTSIADLAAAVVGEGAAIRILSPDLRTIERDVVAHPDEAARRRLESSVRKSATVPVPSEGIPGEVVGNGRLLASTRSENWRAEYQQQFRERVFDGTEHVMIAPIRHNGTVLGMFAVMRTDPGSPYRPGDDDVLQVLADGAGAAVAEGRRRHAAQRDSDERLAALSRRQQELLEKLAGMETRERLLLAESIEDETIQRLAAGIMRLDNLSAQMDRAAYDQLSQVAARDESDATATRHELDRDATREELDRVANQLESTADWLRNLITVALIPPDLTGGLGPALARLARGIFVGTPTRFTMVGPDHVSLAVPAKESAYRIFREALLNVRKHARATAVTLTLEERHDVVVVALSDDGIGSATLDTASEHLGIATMRVRADAEGGQVHVESIEGLGTAVTLTLPRGGLDPRADSGPRGAAQPRTVVVCDDQKYLRDAFRRMLSDVPRFRVSGDAFDRETCLQRITELRPDVLLLAFNMPGGGPQLVKAARELHPDMHIVVYSGRQDVRAMLWSGADQYIVKGGQLQPMIDALDRAVNSRLSG